MKKNVCLFFLICLLCGCSVSNNKYEISRPCEVVYKNNIFTYYSQKEDIPSNFNILNISLENLQDENNNIIIESNESIRCISIVDSDIITYNNISVGDNINKVKDSFLYEFDMIDGYSVIFNEGTEDNPTSQQKEDDWLWIHYMVKDSIITRILIYDVEYGSQMK